MFYLFLFRLGDHPINTDRICSMNVAMSVNNLRADLIPNELRVHLRCPRSGVTVPVDD